MKMSDEKFVRPFGLVVLEMLEFGDGKILVLARGVSQQHGFGLKALSEPVLPKVRASVH